MSRYASQTTVSSENSRAEIERTLRRYGADGFMYGWDGDRAVIGFRSGGRHLRFVLDMPPRDADEFRYTAHRHRYHRRPLSNDAAVKKWEQACRQRWRALALVIKAKLEAVEAGIVTFEQEFFAHFLLPTGRTVYEAAAADLERVLSSTSDPLRLLTGSAEPPGDVVEGDVR